MRILSAITAVALVISAPSVFAQSEPSACALFLKGDYRQCAVEGTRLMAEGKRGKDMAEAYYLAGLSCLKNGDYENARKLFEYILKECRQGKFNDEARIGLADSLYLKGELNAAKAKYEDFLRTRGLSKLKPGVYYRLYLLNKKSGHSADSRTYREKIKNEFPDSPEASLEADIFPVTELPIVTQEPGQNPRYSWPAAQYYTVQLGAFSKKANADKLAAKLVAQGYPAFVDQATSKGSTIFKVKAGRFTTMPEIRKLERRLAAQGYPTKIDKMP